MTASHDIQPADTDTAALTTTRQPKRSVRRKLLFAGIIFTAFFGLLELILAAVGVKPIAYREDPFVGFSGQSPLFRETTTSNGEKVYQTAQGKLRWFNPQQFPSRKGDNDYRIFCLGGSTTFGRPYDDRTSFSGWLRAYLAIADTTRNWQVINAGGISYASYRVAAVMEELADYEPDLFIVYCGHNEFLERRTYSELMATPQFVRDTAAVLGRSRIYTSVRTLLKSTGSQQPTSATDKLSEEVDTILDGSIGPDDYKRETLQRKQVIEHYRFNLQRMIDIANSVGARIIMVTPASNERSMSPFRSQHRGDIAKNEAAQWDKLVEQATIKSEAGQLEEALTALDRAIEIDPLYAETHFRRGEILFNLGQYEAAKDAFQTAITEDVCPLRMLPEMQTVITEVARKNNVPHVNFQQLLESQTETGITGDNWFLDHVHATIDGYRSLALQLVDEMQTQNIAGKSDQWTTQNKQRVQSEVLAQVDDRAQGIALRNLAKVLSWARKYEEAGRLSQQATEKLSDDAEAHCMAAYEFERQKQYQKAVNSYKKAIELRPNYAHAHYNLGHNYRRLKKWELARQAFELAVDSDPNFPGAYYNLGLIHQQQNRLEAAAHCFEASLKSEDKHPGSWEALGNTRINQNRIDEAIKHLTKATELEPKLYTAHNTLGIAFARSGDITKAIECFEKALSIHPEYGPAIQNLNTAQQKVPQASESAPN